MASAPPVQLQLPTFNFTGFDWLIERGYRLCEQRRTDHTTPPPPPRPNQKFLDPRFKLHLMSNTHDEYFAVREHHSAGAPNDGFLLNALKTLFWLSKVLLDLKKSILSDAVKSTSVQSS